MKRWMTISTIAAVALMATSVLMTTGCEEITDAATINVPMTVDLYPTSINPNVPEVDNDCVDLSEDSDYNDNKDKIKGGELKSITFQITELTQPQFDPQTAVFSTVTFSLKFDESYGDNKVYNLGTFNNVAVKDVMNAPMNIPVTNDAKQAIDLIARGRAKFCTECSYGPFTSGPGGAAFLKGHLQLKIDFKAGL